MKCPFCGGADSKVLDSRAVDERATVRRRRECIVCGRRFTTYERWEEAPLFVIKKDGRREPFARSKILSGLMKACEKRPIPTQQLQAMAESIEREVRNKADTEISSKEIGEMVMARLRELDGVAYVRFASVYREFRDVDSFMQELQRLIRGSESPSVSAERHAGPRAEGE